MTEDKIINRIKKMLALANDQAASEGERDNALRMAYGTMAKYNVDMSRVEAFGKPEERVDFDSPGFSMAWSKSVHNTIGKLFFCSYFFGRKINGTQCEHHFIGKVSNAMTAAAIATYVVNSILKEARSKWKYNLAPESRSFALGAANRLRHRVEEIKAAEAAKENENSAGTALVLASLYLTEEKANAEFLSDYNLKSVKPRTSRINTGAYEAGKAFGDKINLSVQVGGNQAERLG